MNKLIAQIQKICAAGTTHVTLTRVQVTRLLDYAEQTASKSRDAETKRLRLAMHRAEQALESAQTIIHNANVREVRVLGMVQHRLQTARKEANANK